MQAAAGVLATQVPSDAKTSPVEKINLDEGTWDAAIEFFPAPGASAMTSKGRI